MLKSAFLVKAIGTEIAWALEANALPTYEVNAPNQRAQQASANTCALVCISHCDFVQGCVFVPPNAKIRKADDRVAFFIFPFGCNEQPPLALRGPQNGDIDKSQFRSVLVRNPLRAFDIRFARKPNGDGLLVLWQNHAMRIFHNLGIKSSKVSLA